MPRPGVYKADVKQAREELIAQGRRASVDAVRVSLGNKGSNSTIHKYLKELEQEEGAPDNRASTATVIRNLVDELAGQLHLQANERQAGLVAEQAAQLRRQAAQIDMLQQEVERLNVQLQQLTAPGRRAGQGIQRHDDMPAVPQGRPGFGVFNSLVQNDRAGVPGFSKFDTFFNSRASAVLLEQGEDVFWKI